MAGWKIYKYVTEKGNCPIDDWYGSKALTAQDRAALDNRVDKIENDVDGPKLPPEWVKKYKNTQFYEFKVPSAGKALRPLCIKIQDQGIILMCGVVKKDKIKKGDLKKAANLIADYNEDKGYAKPYNEEDE